MNDIFQKALLPALISSVLFMTGCGNSSDSNTSDTGRTLTSGIITGFGSIYVNGIKFDTDNASYDVDDDTSADQDDLRIGMRVKINGTVNDDGMTGTADFVIYENELEGPVSVVDSTTPELIVITILGQDIVVNADTTFDNDDNSLDMNTIQVGDLLEVSGYIAPDGIIASHIEKQNSNFVADFTEIEIKGDIANLSANRFTVNGLNIEFDGSTEMDDIPNDTLTNGFYVEVKGTLNVDGDLLTALKIEAENDGLDDDADEVELEGVISDYDEDNQTFKVQGQLIDTSQSPLLNPSNLMLNNDLKIEVEGTLIDGVLIAEEIKLKGRKIKIQAAISSKDMNHGSVSFSLFGGINNLTVRVNEHTDMEDDVGAIEDFNLLNLEVGDFVEVEAFDSGTDVINAIELDRKETDDVQLEGPISEFDASSLTVTMFGLTVALGNAEYEGENSDDNILAEAFYAQLAEGTFVELTDIDPDGADLPDGVIDKAEIEESDDD